MSIQKRIAWFKETFGGVLAAAVRGTPYSVDLLAAIAYEETGYIWGPQIGTLSVSEILEICVGDTIDSASSTRGGRKAFPRNKAALVRVPNGPEMFAVARGALERMARYCPDYSGAVNNPEKFCRGFGIFQFDLQFFKEDPDYFLQKKWHVFDVCVKNCVRELQAAQRRINWSSKTELSDHEMTMVAIAYNQGGANLAKGLQQGYKPKNGKYYGESIASLLRTAKSVKTGGAQAGRGGSVPEESPAPIGVTGGIFRAEVHSFLSLREGPGSGQAQVCRMPPGQLVQRISGEPGGKWWEVEALMESGTMRGFAAARYLKRISVAPQITIGDPLPIDFDQVPGYLRRELKQPDNRIQGGEHGKRVRRVQEWLSYHDCRTPIDGDFGPATARVVRKFQAQSKLPVNGAVNGATWKALVAPMRKALNAPRGIKKLSLSAAIKAVADQHVDVNPREIGGANRGPWVRLYCSGNDGRDWAWCAGFVTLVIKQACFYLEQAPPIEGSVSCDTLAAQAKAAGLFVPESELSSGAVGWDDMGPCVVFLRRRTTTDWTHAGLGFDGQGDTFDTIEGNTNDEGGREGREACRRTRSIARGDYDFIRFGDQRL